MSLKKWIVSKYITDQTIKYILPHSVSEYITLHTKVMIFLCILIIVSVWVSQIIVSSEFLWIIAIVGTALYFKYVYDFLSVYLDSVVLTNKGINILVVDGFMKYRMTFFGRKSIETVDFSQNGLWDYLIDSGNLTLSVDQGERFLIPWLYQPKKQANRIQKMKYEYLTQMQDSLPKDEVPIDKFEMLVDTLSSVITDYMKQGKWWDHEKI